MTMSHLKQLTSFVALLSFFVASDVVCVGSFQLPVALHLHPLRRGASAASVVVHRGRRLTSSSSSPLTNWDTSSSPRRRPLRHRLSSSSSSTSTSPDDAEDDDGDDRTRRGGETAIDPLIYRASLALRASSWLSWWSQLILTVVSSITFLFARNVLATTATPAGGGAAIMGKFLLPGLGIVLSSMSVAWTWGQRRLARRFLRGRTTSRVAVANLLRRTIAVGTGLNLVGLLASVLGAQVIVGTLAAKSMQVFVGGVAGGIIGSQSLQPLDVLIVQANTNILSSHFVSLACLMWLTRMVDLLDPPSLEDDDDN